jgi:hypothetical protein
MITEVMMDLFSCHIFAPSGVGYDFMFEGLTFMLKYNEMYANS